MEGFYMNPNTSVMNQDNLELYKKTQQQVLVNHEKSVNAYLEKIDSVNKLIIQLEATQSDKINDINIVYETSLKSNDEVYQKSYRTILKANDQKLNELLSNHRNIQRRNQTRVDKMNDQMLKLNFEFDRFDDKAKELFQSEEKQIQRNKNKIKKIMDDVSAAYYAKIDSLLKEISLMQSSLSNQRVVNEKTIKQFLSKHKKTSTLSITSDLNAITQLETTYFAKYDNAMIKLKKRITDLNDAYSNRLKQLIQNIDQIDQEVKSYQVILQDEYSQTSELDLQLNSDLMKQLTQLKKQQDYIDIIDSQLSTIREKSLNQFKNQVEKSKAWVTHTDLFYLIIEQEMMFVYKNREIELIKSLDKIHEYQALIDGIQLSNRVNPLTNPLWIDELESIFIQAYRETEKGYRSVFDKLINKIELLKNDYRKIDEIEMVLSFEETFKNDDFLSYKIENTKQDFIYSYSIEKAKVEHEINQLNIIKSIEDKKLELMKKSLQLELERQINDIKYIKNIQDEKVNFDYLINIAEIKLKHDNTILEQKKQKAIYESEIYKLNQEWIEVSQLNSVVYRYETKKIDVKDNLERELTLINDRLINASSKLDRLNQECDFKTENERDEYNTQKENLIEPLQIELNQLQIQVDDIDSNTINEIRKVDHLLEESLAVPRRYVENYQIQNQKLLFEFSKFHDEAEILIEQPSSVDVLTKALNILNQIKSTVNENFETIHNEDEHSMYLYKAYQLVKPKFIAYFKALEKEVTQQHDSLRHHKILTKFCETIKSLGLIANNLYETALQNIKNVIKETVEARNFSVNQIQKKQRDVRLPLIQKINDLNDKIHGYEIKFNETLANVIDVISTQYLQKNSDIIKEIKLIKEIKARVEAEASGHYSKLESTFNTDTNDIRTIIQKKIKDIDHNLNEQLNKLEKQGDEVTNQFKEMIVKSETDYKMNINQAEKSLQHQINQILREILTLEKQMVQIDSEYQKQTTKLSIDLRNTQEDLAHQNSVNKNAHEAKSVLFKQSFEQKMLLKKREIEQIFESKEKIINELMDELNSEMKQIMISYKEIIRNASSQLIERLLTQYIDNSHFKEQLDKTEIILHTERS